MILCLEDMEDMAAPEDMADTGAAREAEASGDRAVTEDPEECPIEAR